MYVFFNKIFTGTLQKGHPRQKAKVAVVVKCGKSKSTHAESKMSGVPQSGEKILMKTGTIAKCAPQSPKLRSRRKKITYNGDSIAVASESSIIEGKAKKRDKSVSKSSNRLVRRLELNKTTKAKQSPMDNAETKVYCSCLSQTSPQIHPVSRFSQISNVQVRPSYTSGLRPPAPARGLPRKVSGIARLSLGIA